MEDIINNEIIKVKNEILKHFNIQLTDEMAFNYVISFNYFLYNENSIEPEYYQIYRDKFITDGPGDGGVDFVYYDDDQQKVIICQCKLKKEIENDEIIKELQKMNTTVECFKKNDSSNIKKEVRKALAEAFGNLPDEDQGNIEYMLFTSASLNDTILLNKINNESYPFSGMVSLYQGEDISTQIQSILSLTTTVNEGALLIDKPNNKLEYESTNNKGIMVNIESNSLIKLFEKYQDSGLFNLNIRRYISNKTVDKGITATLDKDRENFWFYNNGIIIACNDFDVTGNKVKLYGFSIVNGGQTTHLIGKYKGNNHEAFYLPCKIVRDKDEDNNDLDFFTRIAEATNSQKPILPRDLKANAPEMLMLHRWLKSRGVLLFIKRGVVYSENEKKTYRYILKNEELGQILLSFIYQMPGTARTKKNDIFENTNIYNKIFLKNYQKDNNKSNFILDIIDLHHRYNYTVKKILEEGDLEQVELDVLRNAKQIVFSLFGILYYLANKDITIKQLNQNSRIVKDLNFIYSGFINGYSNDDIEDIIKKIISIFATILKDGYTLNYERGETSSISNYFKSDSTYIEKIIPTFIQYYSKTAFGHELEGCLPIFKRKSL